MPWHSSRDSSGSDCGGDLCIAKPPASAVGTTFETALSLSPFIITFFAVCLMVTRHLFPLLSKVHDRNRDDGEDHILPASAPRSLRQCHAEHGSRSVRRRLAAVTFAVTVGLSTVLAELILAEISDLVDASARDAALRVTLPTLLFLLIVLIPFLELQTVIAGSGWSFQRTAKGRFPRVAWTLQLASFGAWLFCFWSLGLVLPGVDESYVYARDESPSFDSTGVSMALRGGDSGAGLPSLTGAGANDLARACLERVGVIGISLMALLSGFASVSSPWHTLTDNRAHKRRPVTDAQIARKQAGLDATTELLATKRHRLRSLRRKGAAASSEQSAAAANGVWQLGLVGKLVGSIKGIGGSTDAAEVRSLQLEISGLESMEASLSSSLSVLRSRRTSHARDGTALGLLLALPSYIFSLYCVYRILATTMTTLRRAYYPGSSFSSSDPINRFLGLLAKHWDPKLDQLAWARQISFLLSGVILAASANSVLQTFQLFAKLAPGLLYQAQANLALLTGQTAATYVISAALLLRSSLPKEVSSAVGDALESALEPGFVDRWFEGWFLLASVATAVGIWIGSKIAGGDGGDWDDWDDLAGEELGQKRS